tara:strand:- start:1449 stop:1862 length:414 start_codon:yes stop_codon:yes gene_type:complete
MDKRIKKALAAGIVGTLGAGLLKKTMAGSVTPNIDKGRGSKLSETFRKKTKFQDAIMRGSKGVKQGTPISKMNKIKNFLGDEIFTTNPKSKVFTLPKIGKSSGYSSFGLGPADGAKTGKMIKARGGGLARSKPTKLV